MGHKSMLDDEVLFKVICLSCLMAFWFVALVWRHVQHLDALLHDQRLYANLQKCVLPKWNWSTGTSIILLRRGGVSAYQYKIKALLVLCVSRMLKELTRFLCLTGS